MGAVLVAAARNEAPDDQLIDTYPALFAGQDIPEIIVVWAATMDSRRVSSSQTGQELTTYAPGHWVVFAKYQAGRKLAVGTSVAAPFVAGLELVSMVWNGQVGDHSCILDDSADECPTLDINDPTPVGGDPSYNAPGTPMDLSRRATFNGTAKGSMGLFGRAAAAACPIGPNGPIKTVSIRPGSPSPMCSGDHCGKLCRGFYCNPRLWLPAFIRPTSPSPHLRQSTCQHLLPLLTFPLCRPARGGSPQARRGVPRAYPRQL